MHAKPARKKATMVVETSTKTTKWRLMDSFLNKTEKFNRNINLYILNYFFRSPIFFKLLEFERLKDSVIKR